jgi:thermitase
MHFVSFLAIQKPERMACPIHWIIPMKPTAPIARLAGALALGLCQFAQALVPNDTLFQYQWPLKNMGGLLCQGCTSNKVGADMKLEQAWNITTGDSSIIVAILDTGCKWRWPDLTGRIWINKGEIDGNGIDDDGNGFVDDLRGWDFHDNDNDPDDLHGHGTSVASIIGSATNNVDGFAAVDWKSKIMILRGGAGNGVGSLSNATAAIMYATQMKARVINISLGSIGAPLSLGFEMAIAQAIQSGIVIVAAASNEGVEGLSSIAELSGVIAVGSTGPDDYRAKGINPGSVSSNYGIRLDLVAPGDYVPALDFMHAEPYNQMSSGTSMATPHVVGVVSLLLAQDPRRTPAQIREILCSTADDQVGDPLEDTPGRDKYHGCGRVNAFRALSQVGTIRPMAKSLRDRLRSQTQGLAVYTADGRKVFKAHHSEVRLTQRHHHRLHQGRELGLGLADYGKEARQVDGL